MLETPAPPLTRSRWNLNVAVCIKASTRPLVAGAQNWRRSAEDIQRQDAARASGIVTYIATTPCYYGHHPVRYAKSGLCVTCSRDVANERYSRKRVEAAFMEARRKRCAKAYKADPEKPKAATRDWELRNPEAVATRWRNRRARKMGADGSHTKAEIQLLFIKQKGRCAYCKCRIGKSAPADHIIPLAKGGSNWIRNIQILCQPCNQEKHAKDPLEFARSRGLLL